MQTEIETERTPDEDELGEYGAVQNLKHLLLLFSWVATGALSATFLRKSGIMIRLLKLTHSLLRFGILTTLKKNTIHMSSTICSKSTVLSGTILKDN